MRRLSRVELLLITAIFSNAAMFFYIAKTQMASDNTGQALKTEEGISKESPRSVDMNDMTLQNEITVVIREFEGFANGIANVINSIKNMGLPLRILIFADQPPYPPLQLPDYEHVKLIIMNGFPELNTLNTNPIDLIQTKYVLFAPDGVVFKWKSTIEKLLKALQQSPEKVKIVAAKLLSEDLQCLIITFKTKLWTLNYDSSSHACTGVEGRAVLLMETKYFYNLSYPLLRPFPESLFIQASVRQWQTSIANDISFQDTKLFSNPHNRWKHKRAQDDRRRNLYKKFGVKKVVKDNYEEYYGCSKESERCFGTVVEDTPEYLFLGRWTPPCCLQAIRKTGEHVFKILEKSGVRYWLEGGSLLGAARNGDVIPWDYDIDIGIYLTDINYCKWLRNAESQKTVDDDGYIWEKATEGQFFRVQYSEMNHLHVDIFPFYPNKKGVMTKKTWFKTHRQDTEFPEHFLKPLGKIQFIGMQVSAPNNVKEFLEYKFGKGVIENPQYPQPYKLKYKPNFL